MARSPLCLIAPLALFMALVGPASAQIPPQDGGPGGKPGGARGGGGGMGPNRMMGLPRSADRVEAWTARIFTRMDTNQDGSITGDELAVLADPTVAAMGGSRMRAMIVQSDANRDSRISVEELTAGAQRMFNRMDRNGDGQLTDDELPQRPARPAPFAVPAAEPADPFAGMNGG